MEYTAKCWHALAVWEATCLKKSSDLVNKTNNPAKPAPQISLSQGAGSIIASNQATNKTNKHGGSGQ